MSLLTIILLTVNFICLVTIIGIFVFLKKQKSQIVNLEMELSSISLSINELEFSLNQQKNSMEKQVSITEADKIESDQVSQSLERRIKNIQTEQIQINNKISSIDEQQPEDKLYSRALKLAGLGADIDEIMKDCDMPRVEAEMLLSIHQQRSK